MLRFLRKYNKFILVIGGSLLMVVFLVPQAVHQMAGNPMKRTAGRLDGQKVTVGDMTLAAQEAAAIGDFLPMMAGLVDRDARDAHWLLLAREAEQAGYVGGPDDGFDWIPDLARDFVINDLYRQYQQFASFIPNLDAFVAQQFASPQGQEMVREYETALLSRRMSIAGQTRLNLDQFDTALAKARGIIRMLDAYQRAARYSDRAGYEVASEYLNYAATACLQLTADDLADDVGVPSREDLVEHFNRFRELEPGSGDFGIGYRLPPRVKLEYLRLSRREIENSIRLDLVDLMKHYSQNRDRFPGEFEAERPLIERELLNAKATRVLDTADAAVRAEIARSIRQLLAVEGYRVLPPDWNTRRPDLVAISEVVVQTVKDAEGVTIPLPAVWIKAADWLTAADLMTLEGIGTARARLGTQDVTAVQLIGTVRELAGQNEIGLQVGVPYADTPLRDAQGNRYYFTVLDASRAKTPESIDELQDSSVVERDWRSLLAYERLAAQASEIAAQAAGLGLEAVAEAYFKPNPENPDDPTPASRIQTRVNVFRETLRPEGLSFGTPEFCRTVYEAASRLDPTVPIDSVPASDRYLAVPVPEARSLVVVRIDGFVPLTLERYRESGDRVERVHAQQKLRSVSTGESPYSLANLIRRHNFMLVGDYASGRAAEAGEGETTEDDGAEGG
ncbi:MAG: hypothetical protein KIS87_07245 [Phycisphaeraceae bacterium]|nr:hypothetical protein [Phycisphaeraceae bacterium]